MELPEDIDESKYLISDLTPDMPEWKRIFDKHLLRYISRARFWQPRRSIGKKCSRFERRDIFTPQQRYKYLKIEDKIPIEPQEMKPVIAALERLIERAVPGSVVDYEDDTPPPNAASPNTVKTVISWMKKKLNLNYIRKKVLHKGLVVGYPMCLMAEYTGNTVSPGVLPLRASFLPWDSVLPYEYYQSEDGSDIDDVIFMKMATKRELFDTYPKRVEQFKQFQDRFKNDPGFAERLSSADTTKTSSDRANLVYDMVSRAKFDSIGGKYFVMEARFPVTKKMTAWINSETLDVIIPPVTWSTEQTEEWLQNNPSYDVGEDVEVKISWVTTISSDGFIWENGPSWYQNDGKLPCAWYIADTTDNLPTGLGEDMIPYVLMIAGCETEGFSQVRKGTGTTTFISEGAVANPGNLGEELSSENGVVLLKKNVDPTKAVFVNSRTPNSTFLDMSERTKNNLARVHRVSNAAMGDTVNRQSERAKQLQIEQTLAPQARYVDNYQAFNLQIENLLCSVLPIVMREQTIIEIEDEFGVPQETQVVNQTEYGYDTEAKIVANDLTSSRYRVEAAIGDDSMTSREAQMSEFIDLLSAIGNQLLKLDPKMLGMVLNTFPNRFAKEAAKYIIETGKETQQAQQAQAQAELQVKADSQKQRKEIEIMKMKTPKVAFKISPEDIKNAPEGARVLYQIMEQHKVENQEPPEAETVAQGAEVQQVEQTEEMGNEQMA